MRSISELQDLTGRKALVTGAAGHIGLAVCETLLELGATIVVLDRTEALVQSRVMELSRRFEPTRILPVVCDLTDETQTRDSTRRSIEAAGGLGILVHCAGYTGDTALEGWAVPFEEQSVSAWDAALRVNLTSLFVLAQESQHALEASGHGTVIALTSIYAATAPDFAMYDGTSMVNPAAYGVSKAGLLQLVRHLASLWAPRIRVNAIGPGGIQRNQPEVFVQRYSGKTLLQRMGTEEDLKGAVAYLASDLSRYVTGQHLLVDGGWTTW